MDLKRIGPNDAVRHHMSFKKREFSKPMSEGPGLHEEKRKN